MIKLSVDAAVKEIQTITRIINPNDYPAIKDSVDNRDTWPYKNTPIFILSALESIYGDQRLSLQYDHQHYDTYINVKVSSAMHFKALKIKELLNKQNKDPFKYDNVLWADTCIQKNSIRQFDAKFKKILVNFADGTDEKKSVKDTINVVKNYNILNALTYDYMNTKWSGQLNPWGNLEFIQNGAKDFDKRDEPAAGLSPKLIKEQTLTKLQKKSIEMDKSMASEIQRIIADNIKKKKEMGIDPDSIKATANKTMADYQSHIETAKKLIGTRNNKIAERFAYHYLFKTK